MKITAKQYALAVNQAIKEGADIRVVADNLTKLLFSRQQFSLWPQIIKQLKEIYKQESGLAEVKVISVKPLSTDLSQLLKQRLKQLILAQQIDLQLEINQDILGGIIIKYNDKVLDGSLKSQISLLKQKLISS